jgi:hypothetical protein
MRNNTSRRLKIQPKVIQKGNSFFDVRPQLLLQGNWFLDAGFSPGQHVDVQVKSGIITIKPCTA